MTDHFIQRADAAMRRCPPALLVFGSVFCLIAALVTLLAVILPPDMEALALRNIDHWMDSEWAQGRHFIDDPLDECDDPCRIMENHGGKLVVFRFAARTLAERKPHGAIIDGACASACAMFADLGRPHVCITPYAAFYFHRSSAESDPPQSRAINAWVTLRGGYPSYHSGDLLRMAWPDTALFWPRCSGQARALYGP